MPTDTASSDPTLAGDLQKSLDRAMQKLALMPNALGIMHGARGDMASALQAFNHVIALEPNFAEALDNKGHILEILGWSEEALTVFTAAAALTPHCADAEARIAELSSVVGRPLPKSPLQMPWSSRIKGAFTTSAGESIPTSNSAHLAPVHLRRAEPRSARVLAALCRSPPQRAREGLCCQSRCRRTAAPS